MKAKSILISVIMGFVFATIMAQQPTQFPQINKTLSKQDLKWNPSQNHPVAQRALSSGKEPGAFQNVTYTYSEKVKVLSSTEKQNLIDQLKDQGRIDKNKITLNPNFIYIDNESEVTLGLAPFGEEELQLVQPKFFEVFADFDLPQQTVQINLANTSYTAPGGEVSDKESGATYDVQMDFNNDVYNYEFEIKEGNTKTKISANITLNGMVGFNKPRVEAQYTKSNGYRLIFLAEEKVELTVKSDLKFSSLTKIPLWEFKIPAEKIGECKVGVYAVIDVNGKITLEAEIKQGIDFEAGVYGRTTYYFPRSVHTLNNTTSYCYVDYKISGEIKAFGGVECTADFKVRSYDILHLRGRGGVEINIKTSEDQKDFEANLGFRLLLDGKVKKIDKDFTLVDKFITLWEKKEKNFGGYLFSISEADAYYNRVHGIILKESDSSAYQGAIQLLVKHPAGNSTIYDGQTNAEGIFALTGVDLKKGDAVQVKIADSPNPSEPLDASIPFQEISLNFADYYTNQVEGVISSKRNTFPAVTSGASTALNPALTKIPKLHNNINKLSPNLKVNLLDFKNSILSYKGTIRLVVRPNGLTFGQQPVEEKPKQNNKAINVSKVNVQIEKIEPPVSLSDLQKLSSYQVEMGPFNMFKIADNQLKPNQRVKAVIEIDGFIVESPWVATSGLIISDIFDENLQGGSHSSQISADKSWAFVSALRSNIVPEGDLNMIKGLDMRHFKLGSNQIPNVSSTKIAELPQAQKPLSFFNETKTLAPNFSHRGESISNAQGIGFAQTSAWSVNNPYYSQFNVVASQVRYPHEFEYLKFMYEGQPVIKLDFQEECPACVTPVTENAKDLNKKINTDKLKNIPQKVRGF